jgi:hypothetical protein
MRDFMRERDQATNPYIYAFYMVARAKMSS